MAVRNYSNTTTEGTLAAGVTAVATTLSLTSFAGYPTAPFTAVIDRNTVDEEVVLVTSASPGSAVVTRGYDGTTAKSHAVGATFCHAVAARDFIESNAHVNATSGVHGLTGSVVGTSDTQTLTNKTLTSPTVSSPTITGSATAANLTVSTSATVPTPVSSGHAATKAYVDGQITTVNTALAGKADTATVSAKANTASPTFTGTVTAPRVVTGGDMTGGATSSDAPVQIGAAGAARALIDSNELWAVNASNTVSTFFINADFRAGGGSPSPTNSAQYVTKGYVDSAVGSDSGWVSVTGFTGRTAHANPPQVRKIGSVVYARGGWTDAGMAINTAYNSPAGIIPAGYRPTQTTVITPGHGSQNRTGRLMAFSDGGVTIESGSTLAGYYVWDGTTWTVD